MKNTKTNTKCILGLSQTGEDEYMFQVNLIYMISSKDTIKNIFNHYSRVHITDFLTIPLTVTSTDSM